MSHNMQTAIHSAAGGGGGGGGPAGLAHPQAVKVEPPENTDDNRVVPQNIHDTHELANLTDATGLQGFKFVPEMLLPQVGWNPS